MDLKLELSKGPGIPPNRLSLCRRGAPRIYERGDGFDVVEMKFSRDFRNDVHRHRLDMVHISIDKRVLAKQIHDARDPARIKLHGVDGLGGEDRFPVGAGDLQSRLNIIVSLFRD